MSEMKGNLNRRDFLKLAGLASFSLALPQFEIGPSLLSQSPDQKNIIVVVLDALSARNISLYGYPRETMPNLSRLAEKALVYHNHYSTGNNTTPGTASLLTGTLSWTHRALQRNDTTSAEFIHKNIFSEFKNYHRIAYSHNIFVNTHLKYFLSGIDDYVPREHLLLRNSDLVNSLFDADEDIASISWIRAMEKEDAGFSYSLFFSKLNQMFQAFQARKYKDLIQDFPRGFPFVVQGDNFILEDAVDHLLEKVSTLPQPFLGYFHFFPPHGPYRTREEFVDIFADDGFTPPEKPQHIFFREDTDKHKNRNKRRLYDEFIRYADAEFARFYDHLEASGQLENTWLILTSDHGELFERRILGHDTPVLHQPVIQIPLLIFEPGRSTRLDIYENTSSIDVLPSLLHLNGQEIPDWIEGELLLPFSNAKPKPDRDIFALEGKLNPQNGPITRATAMLVRGNLKLIYYFGYKELEDTGDLIEMYDLQTDPEEMNNIYLAQKDLGDELLRVIQAKITAVNLPYRS